MQDLRFDFDLGLFEAIDGDGAGLGAAVVADTAARASFTGILRGMYAVLVEIGRELKLFWRAGFHAQTAALALVGVDMDVTA